MKFPKLFLIILIVGSFVLSVKYLYNSWEFLNVNNTKFVDNIVLVFSNLTMSTLFVYLYNNQEKLSNSLLIRILLFTYLLYVVFCVCVLMNNILAYGFYNGESLFYQIISIFLSILIITYISKILRNQNRTNTNVA